MLSALGCVGWASSASITEVGELAAWICEYAQRGSENFSMCLCFYFWYYSIGKEFGSTIFTIGLKQRIKETARIAAFDEVTGREAMKTINCAE